MALTATVYRLGLTLSDVDRGVYETLDLRVARHPSESARYFWQRVLAYCLSYEEGIAFSKGGVSSTEEPAVLVRDATGVLRVWIEVGTPSTARVHKASKAADRVAIYGATELADLRGDAAAGRVHRASEIDVWTLEASFLDALEQRFERNLAFTLVRTEGRLYVTIGAETLEGAIEQSTLGAEARS